MACGTLVPHDRGGVCRAEEAAEETSGEESEGRGALQREWGGDGRLGSPSFCGLRHRHWLGTQGWWEGSCGA